MKILLLSLLLTSCTWTTDPDADKVGQTEDLTVFAYFPKSCRHNTTCWLQMVKVRRHYYMTPFGVGSGEICIEEQCH